MRIERITKYRDSNHLMTCTDGLKECRCREYYLDFPLWHFPNIYADFLIHEKYDAIKKLLEEVCEKRRKDVSDWYTGKL